MKKFFLGLFLGAAIGAGAATMIGSGDHNIELEPLQTTIQKEEKKVYLTTIDKDTFDQIFEDSKGMACYCFDNEKNSGSWCEHEELYCNETAIEECSKQKRFENHTCSTGVSFNLRPR